MPVEPARITLTRQTERLVLAWPAGHELFTSTNVTGPYTPVMRATNLYEVPYADPQRFFYVQPAPQRARLIATGFRTER